MFSGNMVDLIIQTIKSWQVIAVTVAIVLFIFLVNYVTQPHRRRMFVSKAKSRPKKTKVVKEKKKKPAAKTDDEELGLD